MAQDWTSGRTEPEEELLGLPGEVTPASGAPVVFRTGSRRGTRRRWLVLPALFTGAALAWAGWPAPAPAPAPRAIASTVAVEPAAPASPPEATPPSPPPAPAAEPALEAATRPARVRRAPTPAAPAPAVDRAMFVAPNASEIAVDCGGVRGQGTTGVRLRRFPAGTCTVRATVLGEVHTARVEVESVREVRCDLNTGRLACG